MITKNVNYIYKDVDIFIDGYNKMIEDIVEEAKELLKERFILMRDDDIYYDNKLVSIYPNTEKIKLPYYGGAIKSLEDIKRDLKKCKYSDEYDWDVMLLDECEKIFNTTNDSINKNNIINYIDLFSSIKGSANSITFSKNKIICRRGYNWNNSYDNEIAYLVVPIYRFNKNKNLSTENIVKLWIENKLVPTATTYKKQYDMLIKTSKKQELLLKDNKLVLNREELKKAMLSKELEFDIKCDVSDEQKDLLEVDKNRADIEKYDSKVLTDPNRGHWDLWTDKQPENTIKVELKDDMIARNPEADIKHGGVVGIDFGTKSTIVVHQEDSEYTLPMRVGVGKFRKTVDKKHYENPTVMEFINLEKFLNEYKSKSGRPYTSWEDLTISHTAFDGLMNCKSEEYYAYFSELKQWCGDRNKRIRIKDKQKNIYDLPTFLELKEDEMNPLEIYAYYLGSYINNMHNGIYLNYILSFPVTYEKEIREKIIKSFEKGIKKSLPQELNENEEIMNEFRVSSGASEPAAYAISALKEYGFEPEDNEKIFYGIFDFGGGTADFDFGIFREASGKKERRYDFVVEQFGAGGDRYLGGENLLELLAFEVFKENAEMLREKGITFILPPECKKFPGSEVLINESQESKINTRLLMEKLRPLWEMQEGYEEIYSKGIIDISLFDKDGNPVTKLQPKIDMNKLSEILRSRIERGVKNFFESLRIAFNNENTSDINEINIFLAGNSSKSPIVRELFDKYIEEETQAIAKLKEKKSSAKKDSADMDKIFEVYPPLGTEEAYKIQEELGMEVERDNFKKPTGKTGVAFGIVASRPGGGIKVINMDQENDEAKFRYYIGENRRDKFKPIIDVETKYNEWYEFIDAYEEDFEIYYTSMPEASTKKMPISETSRIKCRIKETFEDDDVMVYVRAVAPTCIEYVVAKESELKKEKYMSDIVKLQLD